MTTREIPQDVAEAVKTAKQLDDEGRALIDRAAQIRQRAVRLLDQQGWNQNQIAAALGVSRQRVSQLFQAARLKVTRPET